VDVMVLSDKEYKINIPISSVDQEDSKVSVMFKKLAGEEQLGKL
jgi:hypothetical protein